MAEQQPFDYAGRWNTIVQGTHQRLKSEGRLEGVDLTHAALHQSLRVFLLECFNEDISQDVARPWAPLEGRSAAELKAIQAYHWLPETVRQLSDDDLFFALQEQIVTHSYPPEVYQAIKGIFGNNGALSHIDHLAPASEA